MSERTLVIFLSETRAHEITYDNIKKNLIDELEADVCVCIGVTPDYDYENPFYKLAKYRFLYDEPEDFGDAFEYAYNTIKSNSPQEPYEIMENVNCLYGKVSLEKRFAKETNVQYVGHYDTIDSNFLNTCKESQKDTLVYHTGKFRDPYWQNSLYSMKAEECNQYMKTANVNTYKKPLYWREFLKIKHQYLGGIKDKEHEHTGSAGILIFFRWFLLQKLQENNLLEQYDRFIITRSDYLYRLPHPKLNLLDPNNMWFPDNEHYEGFTDRHVVLSRNHVIPYLNILDNMVLKSNSYFMQMMGKDDWNLEQVIKFNLTQENVVDKVREFPYVMFTVRTFDGKSRGNAGVQVENNYIIKYCSEYYRSLEYKILFENEKIPISQFYTEIIQYKSKKQ